MELEQIMTPDSVITGLKINSKKQVLQELAQKAAKISGLEERTIFDVILERERLGTTGVGNGVAIPHGRMKSLDKVHGFFMKLDNPIDFESVDNKPVDLVFMLLAPEGAGADHLKALAKVSRLLRDDIICSKIRGSSSDDAIFALFSEECKDS